MIRTRPNTQPATAAGLPLSEEAWIMECGTSRHIPDTVLGRRTMSYRRATAAGALAIALIGLLATGCNDDGTPPTSDPSDPTTSASANPTEPTASAWESKYTEDELEAFEKALATWTRYEKLAEPIWAKGKATKAAQQLFRKYWATNSQYSQLQRHEAGQIRVEGVGVELWAKPIFVKLGPDGDSLSIRRCVDGTGVKVFQGDKQLMGGTDRPQIIDIRMFSLVDKKTKSTRWWIVRQSNPQGKKPCSDSQ